MISCKSVVWVRQASPCRTCSVLGRWERPLPLEARGEPTYVVGDTTLPYLKLTTQGSAYLPFGKLASTVLKCFSASEPGGVSTPSMTGASQ